jgi:hypothetical protein
LLVSQLVAEDKRQQGRVRQSSKGGVEEGKGGEERGPALSPGQWQSQAGQGKEELLPAGLGGENGGELQQWQIAPSTGSYWRVKRALQGGFEDCRSIENK